MHAILSLNQPYLTNWTNNRNNPRVPLDETQELYPIHSVAWGQFYHLSVTQVYIEGTIPSSSNMSHYQMGGGRPIGHQIEHLGSKMIPPLDHLPFRGLNSGPPWLRHQVFQIFLIVPIFNRHLHLSSSYSTPMIQQPNRAV